MELLLAPWPWYVAGPIIAAVMFLLLYFGETFGVSSNLRTLCTMGGAHRYNDFFKIEWRAHLWNLVFVVGAVIGGYISAEFLSYDNAIELSQKTLAELNILGLSAPTDSYLPAEIFSIESLFSVKGFLVLLLGGVLVGFGARYAGGCTSGHAITGLSNLQIPSLVAVVGFFIGGLIMTHLLLPIIL